jgi:YVTN family beta-propeller protein
VPQLRAGRSVKVGRRPNVARAAAGNVFVGSYRRSRVTILDADTGTPRANAPRVGFGMADGAVSGDSVWLAISKSRVVVRLDARTGKVRKRLPLDGNPRAVAVSGSALWVGLTHRDRTADTLLKLDPRTGRTLASADYQYGIASLAVSPNAVWVVSRFRSFTFRADPRSGEPKRRVPVGHAPATDAAYGRNSLWITVPRDDTIYQVRISTAEVIPISVGHNPRQIEVDGHTVYVTNFNSSDVYAIDARSSHVIGTPVVLPANPYSIAALRDAVWVTSPPEDRITRLITARGE